MYPDATGLVRSLRARDSESGRRSRSLRAQAGGVRGQRRSQCALGAAIPSAGPLARAARRPVVPRRPRTIVRRHSAYAGDVRAGWVSRSSTCRPTGASARRMGGLPAIREAKLLTRRCGPVGDRPGPPGLLPRFHAGRPQPPGHRRPGLRPASTPTGSFRAEHLHHGCSRAPAPGQEGGQRRHRQAQDGHGQ